MTSADFVTVLKRAAYATVGQAVCEPTGGAFPDGDQHDYLLPGDACPYCRAAL